jgi:hypothetical protein
LSDKTTLGRLPQRAVTDREQIYAILDDGLMCHVGYIIDGRPVVIPTFYARDGDRVLIHGSNSAGMIKAVRRGSPICVAVTHLDGIVVARSGFNSSANYRSVVIHGEGRILAGDEHESALNLMVEALIPGRSADIRAHTPSESKQTTVFALDLDEVSAKVRTGGPGDDPDDLDSDAWAGVIPIRLVAGNAEPDPELREEIGLPDYLNPYPG